MCCSYASGDLFSCSLKEASLRRPTWKEIYSRPPETFSAEKDLFEARMAELNIGTTVTDGMFIDIGVPDDYKKAQTVLKPYQ